MADTLDELYREIGRAVVEQTNGIPGPDGYLLEPTPDVGSSGTTYSCPSCAGVAPAADGDGHRDDCPLARLLDRVGQ